MATPEGRIKIKLKRALEEFHPRYEYWPVPGGYGTVTVDCHLLYCGRFYAIECKAPGKHPTPMQQAALNKVCAAGGYAFVVDGDDAIARLCESLREAKKEAAA